MTNVVEFRLTVGQQYPGEAHPTMSGIGHNNWVAIYAATMREAQRMARECLGLAWSAIYSPEDAAYPTLKSYPDGELYALINKPQLVVSDPRRVAPR